MLDDGGGEGSGDRDGGLGRGQQWADGGGHDGVIVKVKTVKKVMIVVLMAVMELMAVMGRVTTVAPMEMVVTVVAMAVTESDGGGDYGGGEGDAEGGHGGGESWLKQ